MLFFFPSERVFASKLLLEVWSARHFDCVIFTVTSPVESLPTGSQNSFSTTFQNKHMFALIQANIFIYSNMVKRCVVQFCGNSNKTGHSMYKFPDDVNLRRQWTKFVQMKRADFIEPTKHSIICSDHFTPDCFAHTCKKWALKRTGVCSQVLYR